MTFRLPPPSTTSPVFPSIVAYNVRVQNFEARWAGTLIEAQKDLTRHNEHHEAAWGGPSARVVSILKSGMATVFVASALLWSYLLHPWLSSSFLVLFLIAVTGSAWYGHLGSGLYAA